MTAPTDALVEILRRLLDAATPGPWAWAPQSGEHVSDGANLFGLGGQQVIAHNSYENMWFAAYDTERDEANAALIVEAINALPTLLAERKMLLARIEAAEKVIAPFARYFVDDGEADIAPADLDGHSFLNRDFRAAAQWQAGREGEG